MGFNSGFKGLIHEGHPVLIFPRE